MQLGKDNINCFKIPVSSSIQQAVSEKRPKLLDLSAAIHNEVVEHCRGVTIRSEIYHMKQEIGQSTWNVIIPNGPHSKRAGYFETWFGGGSPIKRPPT